MRVSKACSEGVEGCSEGVEGCMRVCGRRRLVGCVCQRFVGCMWVSKACRVCGCRRLVGCVGVEGL